MPVPEGTPDELAVAIGRMEDAVQSFKEDISYKAPEQHDMMYAIMQMEIAQAMVDLYKDLTDARSAE